MEMQQGVNHRNIATLQDLQMAPSQLPCDSIDSIGVGNITACKQPPAHSPVQHFPLHKLNQYKAIQLYDLCPYMYLCAKCCATKMLLGQRTL